MNEKDRLLKLLGEEKVNKLSNSHVLIFGLGGVGSYAAEAIARSFIGSITLVDNDIVSDTDINRQLYALHSTLGISKTAVSKSRILDINPECKVTEIPKFYTPELRDEFFKQKYDYVIDAIDNVTAKLDIIEYCKSNDIPVISSMGTGNKLHPEMLVISDIYDTKVCPLCRVMRHELRKRDIKSLDVIYSPEEPAVISTPPASCSFVPPVAGMLLASKAVNDIISKA